VYTESKKSTLIGHVIAKLPNNGSLLLLKGWNFLQFKEIVMMIYWLQATWQPNISTMAASPATAVVLSSGQLSSALNDLSHEVIS
jgi:hypothetical protein